MVEFFLILMLPVLLLPQLSAGYLARQMGRSYWLWFGISFLLPIFSLAILLMLKDKQNEKTIANKSLPDQ
jgi:hypothetical protein